MISRAEWDKRYPDREPFATTPHISDIVFTANITHNLNQMAEEAGIYTCLWRPEEIGITHAWELILPLEEGLQRLRDDPNRFAQFNPKNGWGTYDTLVGFVLDYLLACELYPQAIVSVSR